MKMLSARALPLALVTMVALLCGRSEAEEPRKTQGGTVRQEPYVAYGCEQCHGSVGQGGWAGPPLARNYPLVGLMAKVRTRSGRMPAFSARVLPDADVERIARYLATLPKDPAAEDIPQLSR